MVLARVLQHAKLQAVARLMSIAISVVVCVFNGANTLAGCLRALEQQRFPRDQFEIVVVDDGSTDDSAQVARRFNVRLEQGPHRGLAAARNTGWRAARGDWVAFTDDDCGPARHWLQSLWQSIHQVPSAVRVLGAAGRIVGFPSNADPARYVELRGGFNTDRHLAHPRFPYAPMGNVLYRREALEQVRGLDERYAHYEACDLHSRLRSAYGGEFYYEPRAIVFHRHYESWAQYFWQQHGYGRGMAQFMWHYRAQVRWSVASELLAWIGILALAGTAMLPGTSERELIRRGDFVKQLALRLGFVRTYWSGQERRRWQAQLLKQDSPQWLFGNAWED